MESFGLILGHLIGDYILQNDWQAGNKTNPLAGDQEHTLCQAMTVDTDEAVANAEACESAHKAKRMAARVGHLACTVHCLLYTFAVWACSFWWVPWWGLLVCFVVHWPVDRFRLARWWMTRVAGQTQFATGALAPWSVIVVDQCFHLLTLFVIGVCVWHS